MEIARGVYFFRGRKGDKLRRGTASCNVTVIEGDGLAVIDSGTVVGGVFREFRRWAAAQGLDLRTSRWILHTHAHWDHINANQALQALTSPAPKVAAAREETPYIEDPGRNFDAFLKDLGDLRREVSAQPMVLLRFLVWFAWGSQPRLRVDRALADGDRIDLGRRIEAVSLPGHTTGHMGYFLPDDGVLVTGDLFDFENAHGMDLNNPLSDYHAGLRSLDKAIALEPEVVVPGHGPPTTGRSEARALLERAREAGRAYPRRIRETLGGEPLTLAELTDRLYPGTPFSMEAMTRMLVLSVLRSMEETGEARRTERSGRPAWVTGESA